MSQFPNAAAETTCPAEPAKVRADWRSFGLLMLAAAAFLPTLAGIFAQGPEYDEAIVMLTVSGHTGPIWPQEPAIAGEIQAMFADRTDITTLLADIRNTDVHPPLHYVAAWLMHLVTGPNLPAQRMLSLAALAGCLFLLVGQWRRDVDGDLPSTVVFILLFTLAPASYYAGSTARGYALVFLLLTAAYVALRRLAGDRETLLATSSLGPAAVVGIGTGLALLTHYLAAVPAAVLGFAALTLLARRRDWRGLAILCASAAVPVLIAGWFLLSQLDARGGYEPLAFPGFAAVLWQMAISLFILTPSEWLPVPEAGYSMLSTAAMTAVALFAAAILAVRKRDFMKLWLPIIIVVSHVVGLTLQQWVSGASLTFPRYLAIVWPFTAIVLAHGALWYRRRIPGGMAVPALLVAVYVFQVGLALIAMPGAPFKYIVEDAIARPGNTILLVDRGYGRGIPGAIVLAAPVESRLWVVTPEQLEAAPASVLPDGFDEIHFALSINESSKEPISRWLDRFPDRAPYVEQDTDIFLHRYFARRPATD
jgi:hypothetical protein